MNIREWGTRKVSICKSRRNYYNLVSELQWTGMASSSYNDCMDAVTCGRNQVNLSERCCALI